MSAYELGWMAAQEGKSIMDCPFHKASGESIAWRNGWRDAYKVVIA